MRCPSPESALQTQFQIGWSASELWGVIAQLGLSMREMIGVHSVLRFFAQCLRAADEESFHDVS